MDEIIEVSLVCDEVTSVLNEYYRKFYDTDEVYVSLESKANFMGCNEALVPTTDVILKRPVSVGKINTTCLTKLSKESLIEAFNDILDKDYLVNSLEIRSKIESNEARFQAIDLKLKKKEKVKQKIK